MGEPILLLPPSEGKAPGGNRRWSPGSGRFRALSPQRQAVIDAVGDLIGRPQELAKLTGTKGALLERAEGAWRLLVEGSAPQLPAWQRFTGVVWEHLDPAGLNDSQRSRILVVNGLTGLAAGGDPVPDFRLKMNLSVPGLGRVDRYWSPHLAPAVVSLARGAPVVNLLPVEHDAALGPVAEQVKVSFSGPGGRAAGHAAKAVKGAFARHLLEEGLEALGRFRWEGWRARRVRTEEILVSAP